MSNSPDWSPEEFSTFLSERMAAAGIKRDAELAREAGINASLISRWRSGVQQPSRDSLRPVAEALQIKPVLLWIVAGIASSDEMDLSEEPSLQALPVEVRTLLDVLADPKLPETQRAVLLGAIGLLVDGVLARASATGGTKRSSQVNRSA